VTGASLRLLGEADGEALARLRRRGYETDPLAFAGLPESDPTCRGEVVARRLAHQTPETGSVAVGAFGRDGALVGMVGVRRLEPGKFRHTAHLWGVYVVPEARRAGVGRSLLLEAGRTAGRMGGVERLTLSVCVACEPAVALYRALGFGVFGREPEAFKVDGAYHDELHMAVSLQALGRP